MALGSRSNLTPEEQLAQWQATRAGWFPGFGGLTPAEASGVSAGLYSQPSNAEILAAAQANRQSIPTSQNPLVGTPVYPMAPNPFVPAPPPPSLGSQPAPPAATPPPATPPLGGAGATPPAAKKRPNLTPDAQGIVTVPGIGPAPQADIDSAGGLGKWIAGHIASGAAYDQAALAAAGLMPGQFSPQIRQFLQALQSKGIQLPDPASLTDEDVHQLLQASGAPAMPSGTGYTPQGWLSWVVRAAAIAGAVLTGGAAAGVLPAVWAGVGAATAAAGTVIGQIGGAPGGAGQPGAGGPGEETPWWQTALGLGTGALGGYLNAQQQQLPEWVEQDLRYWMRRRQDQERQANEDYGGYIDPETGEYVAGTRGQIFQRYGGMFDEPGYTDEEIANMFYSPAERESLYLTPDEQQALAWQPSEVRGGEYADWEAKGMRFSDEEQSWFNYTVDELKRMGYSDREAQELAFSQMEAQGLRYTPEQKEALRVSPQEEAGIMAATLAPIAGSANRARNLLTRLGTSKGTSGYGANIARVEEEAGRQAAEAALRARLNITQMRREGERDIAQQDIYGTESTGRQRIAAAGTVSGRRMSNEELAARNRIEKVMASANRRIEGTREVAGTRIANARATREQRANVAGDIAEQRLGATQNILGQRIGTTQALGQQRIAGQQEAARALERLSSADLDRMLGYSGQARLAPPMSQPSSVAGAVTGALSGVQPILADWRKKRQSGTSTRQPIGIPPSDRPWSLGGAY